MGLQKAYIFSIQTYNTGSFFYLPWLKKFFYLSLNRQIFKWVSAAMKTHLNWVTSKATCVYKYNFCPLELISCVFSVRRERLLVRSSGYNRRSLLLELPPPPEAADACGGIILNNAISHPLVTLLCIQLVLSRQPQSHIQFRNPFRLTRDESENWKVANYTSTHSAPSFLFRIVRKICNWTN